MLLLVSGVQALQPRFYEFGGPPRPFDRAFMEETFDCAFAFSQVWEPRPENGDGVVGRWGGWRVWCGVTGGGATGGFGAKCCARL